MKKINLNQGWKFSKLKGQSIENPQETDEAFDIVDLPHTWYQNEDPYRGLSVYVKEVDVHEYTDKKLFLEIEAADHTVKAYVNGIYLGIHKGGYSRIRYAIPKECISQGKLDFHLYVDNGIVKDVSPLAGDFTIFGGIYRNVNLIIAEETHFDYTYFGTDGVIVYTDVMEDGAGELFLEPHVILNNANKTEIYYIVYGPDGSIAAEAKEHEFSKKKLILPDVQLWNGKKGQPLYTIQAELREEGRIVDKMEIVTGFRKIRIDSDKGFFLNGEHTRLLGVAKHQDTAEKFNAVEKEDVFKDFDIIKEVGANAVRLSHYQHSQTAYDCCDKGGFITWAEIPMLKMTEDKELQENAKLQLTELIIQNIHHPSICFWGIQNEVAMFRDCEFVHQNVRELYNLAKKLDPERIVTCANLYPLKGKSMLNHLTDMVGYNIYFGWYYGKMEDYGAFLDKLHESLPKMPLGVSEYGVDTAVWLHSETPMVKDYSEEFQALFHETVYPILESKEYLWGSFIWNMFDFSSSRRNEGGQKFINAKGLVTYDRKTKKDAFYYYKAKWSETPFIHICERRFEKRSIEKLNIKVYTNQKEAMLFNGQEKLMSVENNGNGTILFPNVPLENGKNVFCVKTVTKDGEILEECITFEKVNIPEESYQIPGNQAGLTVQNWFLQEDDIDTEQYFSLEDRAEDLLGNEKTHRILTHYLPDVTVLLEKGIIPIGLPMTSIINYDKEAVKNVDLKALNLELLKITK